MAWHGVKFIHTLLHCSIILPLLSGWQHYVNEMFGWLQTCEMLCVSTCANTFLIDLMMIKGVKSVLSLVFQVEQDYLAACIEGKPRVCVNHRVHWWSGSGSYFPNCLYNLLFCSQIQIFHSQMLSGVTLKKLQGCRAFRRMKVSGFKAFSDHCLMTVPSCETPRPHCKAAVIL